MSRVKVVWRFRKHPMARRFGLPRILWHTKEGWGREVSLSIAFEPRDVWIGVYWDRPEFAKLVLYLCLIPMLPFRVAITTSHGGRHF